MLDGTAEMNFLGSCLCSPLRAQLHESPPLCYPLLCGKVRAVFVGATLEDCHKNLQFICDYYFSNTQLAHIYHTHILCHLENCISATWEVQNVLDSCMPLMR